MKKNIFLIMVGISWAMFSGTIWAKCRHCEAWDTWGRANANRGRFEDLKKQYDEAAGGDDLDWLRSRVQEGVGAARGAIAELAHAEMLFRRHDYQQPDNANKCLHESNALKSQIEDLEGKFKRKEQTTWWKNEQRNRQPQYDYIIVKSAEITAKRETHPIEYAQGLREIIERAQQIKNQVGERKNHFGNLGLWAGVEAAQEEIKQIDETLNHYSTELRAVQEQAQIKADKVKEEMPQLMAALPPDIWYKHTQTYRTFIAKCEEGMNLAQILGANTEICDKNQPTAADQFYCLCRYDRIRHLIGFDFYTFEDKLKELNEQIQIKQKPLSYTSKLRDELHAIAQHAKPLIEETVRIWPSEFWATRWTPEAIDKALNNIDASFKSAYDSAPLITNINEQTELIKRAYAQSEASISNGDYARLLNFFEELEVHNQVFSGSVSVGHAAYWQDLARAELAEGELRQLYAKILAAYEAGQDALFDSYLLEATNLLEKYRVLRQKLIEYCAAHEDLKQYGAVHVRKLSELEQAHDANINELASRYELLGIKAQQAYASTKKSDYAKRGQYLGQWIYYAQAACEFRQANALAMVDDKASNALKAGQQEYARLASIHKSWVDKLLGAYSMERGKLLQTEGSYEAGQQETDRGEALLLAAYQADIERLQQQLEVLPSEDMQMQKAYAKKLRPTLESYSNIRGADVQRYSMAGEMLKRFEDALEQDGNLDNASLALEMKLEEDEHLSIRAGSFYERIKLSNGVFESDLEEKLELEIEADGKSALIQTQELMFAVSPYGDLKILQLDRKIENISIQSNKPCTLNASAIQLARLEIDCPEFNQIGSLEVSFLGLKSQITNLEKVFCYEALEIDATHTVQLNIKDLAGKSLKVQGNKVELEQRIECEQDSQWTVKELVNWGEIEAQEFSCLADQFTNAGHLNIGSQLTLNAKHISNLRGVEPGKLAAKTIEIYGFDYLDNQGTIGAITGGELGRHTLLQCAGKAMANSGSMLASVVQCDLAQPQEDALAMTNSGVIHAHIRLEIKSSSSVSNEKTLSSGASMQLECRSFNNAQACALKADSITLLGQSDWINEGEIVCAKLTASLAGSFINKGEIHALSLGLGIDSLLNASNIIVAQEAVFNIKNSLGNAPDGVIWVQGDCTFENLNTLNNHGVIRINGVLDGSVGTFRHTGKLIIEGGMHTNIYNDWTNEGNLTCLGDSCLLSVAHFINEGKVFGAAQDLQSDSGKQSNHFQIHASNGFTNKGIIGGGRQTSLVSQGDFNNYAAIQSSGPIAVQGRNILNDASGHIASSEGVDLNAANGSLQNYGKLRMGGGSFTAQVFENYGQIQSLSKDQGLAVNAEQNIYLAEGSISASGGLHLRSTAGDITMRPGSSINAFANSSINAAGLFQNTAADMHIHGNLDIKANHINNIRLEAKQYTTPVSAHGQHCTEITHYAVGKQPNIFVTENAHLKATGSITNDAGSLFTMGDIRLHSPHISNNGQTLLQRKCELKEHVGSRKYEVVGPKKKSYSYEHRDSNTYLPAIMSANGKIWVRLTASSEDVPELSWDEVLHPSFRNTGHLLAGQGFDLVNDLEGVASFIQGLTDNHLSTAVALAQPLSGLLLPELHNANAIEMYGLRELSKEENPLYAITTRASYLDNIDAWAEYWGLKKEDLLLGFRELVIIGEEAKRHDLAKLRFLLDPFTLYKLVEDRFGPYMHTIEGYVRRTQPGLLADSERLSSAKWANILNDNAQKLVKNNPQIGYSGHKALSSGDPSDGDETQQTELISAAGTDLATEQFEASALGALAFTVCYKNDEPLICPVIFLPEELQEALFHPEGLLLSGGPVEIDMGPQGTVTNTGTIISAGTLSIEAQIFENEQRVYEHEQSVWESKGFLRGSRKRTFTIQDLQPGGNIYAIEVEIIVEDGFKSTGGLITATHNINIISKSGDIEIKPQHYSRIVSWDPGTLGRLQGKQSHALATEIYPAQLISGEGLNLKAEAGNLLIKAAHLVAQNDIELFAYGDIIIENDSTKHLAQHSTHCRGPSCTSAKAEAVINQPTKLISRSGSITIESAEGSIEMRNSHAIAGNTIYLNAAKDIHISGDIIKTESKLRTTGPEFFYWNNVATITSQEQVFQSVLNAANGIFIESGEDTVLEAVIAHGGKYLYIVAGRDILLKDVKQTTQVQSSGWSLGISFFGSDAIQTAASGGSFGEVALALADEDPLIQAIDTLTQADGAMDIEAAAMPAAVQLWQALYVYDKVHNGVLNTKGALGQRWGITDIHGNFDPRITVNLNVFSSDQKTAQSIPTQVSADDVKFEAHRNIDLIDGTQVDGAHSVELLAGGNITLSACQNYSDMTSDNTGGSFGFGGGTVITVGANQATASQSSAVHNNAVITAPRFSVQASGSFVMKGAVVSADDVDIKANDFHLESLQDSLKSDATSWAIDTGGTLAYQTQNQDGRSVGQASGVYATKSFSAIVQNILHIKGGILSGPRDTTVIKADTMIVEDVQEYNNIDGWGLNLNAVLDTEGMGIDGNGVLGTAGGNYLKQRDAGVVHSVITTDNIDANRFCNAFGQCDDSIRNKIKRDPSEMRESTRNDKTYINLAIPLINTEAFSKNWAEIKQTLFENKPSPSAIDTKDFNDTIQKLLGECHNCAQASEGPEASEDVQDQEGSNPASEEGFRCLFGENWEGEAYAFTHEDGEDYIIYSGSTTDENGARVEQTGVIKQDILLSEANLFSPENGQVKISYNTQTGNVFIDSQSEYGRASWTQSAESIIGQSVEAVQANAPEAKTVVIQVNTFIGAQVLEFWGRWQGDGRAHGEEGTSRTVHIITLQFEDGQSTIICETRMTGVTHKLDNADNIIDIGQSSGRTLKATIHKEYSTKYKDDIFVLRMEGNEKNPIALPTSARKIPYISAPGITYEFEAKFNPHGDLLELKTDHDQFPSVESMVNGEMIYTYKEAESSKIMPWPALYLVPIFKNIKEEID